MEKKSKRGFTLLELSIVLALIAVVVAMATYFMVAYRRSTNRLGGSNEAITDISQIQASIREWILQYDNTNTTFDVGTSADNTSQLTATVEGSATPHTWTFSAKHIAVDGTAEAKEFPCVTACYFSKEGNLVTCTVTFTSGSGNYSQDVLFAIMSNGVRNRYSDPDRE